MPEKSTQEPIMQRQSTDEDLYGETFFSWRITEYTDHQRTKVWYLAMFLVALFFIIISLFTRNYYFAIIIILAVFIIFLKHYYESKELEFKITENGLTVGQQYFPYEHIKEFFIIYDPPHVKKLFFILKGIRPTISIPLVDMNPLLIREKLREYLFEDIERETQTLDDQLDSILKL